MAESAANLLKLFGTAWHVEAVLIHRALGHKTGSGTPDSVVAPDFIGQEYFDTVAAVFYRATGLTNSDWVALDGSGGLDGSEILRVVTAAGAVTVTGTDFVIVIKKTSGAATTVNLPASPTVGQTFVIKDGKGDCGTNNITITPNAGTIDGASTAVMQTNYQSATIVYTGTEWSLI